MARFDRLEFGGSEADDSARHAPRARRSRDEKNWLQEAEANRRQGQYENALRYYSRALEIDKTLVKCWTGQVQMLVLLDELPEADLWARKALEIFQGNGELLAARAQALCRLGNKSQALAQCDAALTAAGNSAFRWQVRGELMLATKQGVHAHCFDKAQQLDRDWLVPLESALIYLHHRLASRGQALARTAVEMAPDQFYCWYVYGCAQAELRLHRQARASFAECLKLSPRHVEATERLAALESGRGILATMRRWFGGS